VDVSNYGKYQPGLEAAFTSMLRTGNVPPELKHLKGAAKKLKNQIKDFRATGGVDGGAWEWNTPSSGMPTTIPGQGTINWGNSPGMSATPPPAPGAPPPQMPVESNLPPYMPQQTGGTSPNGWQRPAALPSPMPYKAQEIQALRAPNAQSRLLPSPQQTGGYKG
jgi:hypothetical protein